MTLFLLLLKKYWKILTLMLLVAFLLWRTYHAGYDSANTAWTLKWAQRDQDDSTAALHRDVSERAEEERRQSVVDKERRHADEELAKVQADADAARRAGNRLQQQLATIQKKYGRSETGSLSALADASAAKAEIVRVFAELLSESDTRAGVYAAEADRAYIAGGACEQAYDKVTSP